MDWAWEIVSQKTSWWNNTSFCNTPTSYGLTIYDHIGYGLFLRINTRLYIILSESTITTHIDYRLILQIINTSFCNTLKFEDWSCVTMHRNNKLTRILLDYIIYHEVYKIILVIFVCSYFFYLVYIHH